MDRRNRGNIRRSDYVWAIGEHGGCIEFHRAVRRADLCGYFHSTAKDLSLAEFMRRALPSASCQDLEKVGYWMNLWKAHSMVTRPTFMGRRDEIQQVFSLLDKSHIGVIRVRQLVNGRLFSWDELNLVLPEGTQASTALTFNEFCDSVQPMLVAKFCQERREKELIDITESCAALCPFLKGKPDETPSCSPSACGSTPVAPARQAPGVVAPPMLSASVQIPLEKVSTKLPPVPPVVQQARRRLGALGGG